MKSYNVGFRKLSSKKIKLNSSKSESNRLLILKALSNNKIKIKNLSKANDTVLLNNLIKTDSNSVWDIEDAGTSMRFLTSYLSIYKEGVTLTGTPRMKKRPIKILVDALNEIGSKITYLENEGYPPIKIEQKVNQIKNSIAIRGDVSSQYISSLLMIAPILGNGLFIDIKEPFYSKPYVDMTLKLMEKFGIKSALEKNQIKINHQKYVGGEYYVESDWSAASYWYSIVCINNQIDKLKLLGLRENSFQGDKIISKIMILFGVKTQYEDDGILIKKSKSQLESIELNFKDCPDLAQTIIVIAAFMKIELKLYGVESLKIKETNRLLAMKSELKKIGCDFLDMDNHWILKKRKNKFPKNFILDTYEDHRMAMAFSPLASELNLKVNNPEVVKKSYPNFWNDLLKVGYDIT